MFQRRVHRAAPWVAIALSLCCADVAQAITCYTLLDRNDNVVYRDTRSPIDLSDQATPGRASLQKRGEYLMISEAERCPQVAFVFGNAGTTNLSTDEFLNGIQSARSPRPDAQTASGTRMAPMNPVVTPPPQSAVPTAK
jgi:hypothetical protein